MALEIERKFLVRPDAQFERDLAYAERVRLSQFYLTASELSVRVRTTAEGAWLTIKGKRSGIVRLEFDYAIPLADAEAMRELAKWPPLDKERFRITYGQSIWEVDVFAGQNAPLVMAEIELTSPEQAFTRPTWLGAEVSHDGRYYNTYLAEHPFGLWTVL